MKYKKAFTLIEMLIVIFIISILVAILSPKFLKVKDKAEIASCLSNVKALSQALNLYVSDTGGYLIHKTYASCRDNVENIFGTIFTDKGWNNLNNLVCPLNSSKIPPQAQGFGAPLSKIADSTIDYWVVFTGNTFQHNLDGNDYLNLLMAPGNNVLIIEKLNAGFDNWGNNHTRGGSVGYVNGSAEFLLAIPKNSDVISKSEADISEVSKFD